MKIVTNWTVGPKDTKDSPIIDEVPAQVPGGAQLDYANFHHWGDYNYGQKARQYDGLEEKYWLYKTTVNLPHNTEGKDVFLVAKGIDYEFEIRLNNEIIWYQEGMFTSVEINLTGKIKNDDTIEVLIYPAPKRQDAIVHDRQEADQSCKPAVSYGWDWHPYLVVLGIWDEFYIDIREKERVEKCELFYTLSKDYSSAFLHFETTSTTNGAIEYSVYDKSGEKVICTTEPDFELKKPELWWCNGQGEAYLYQWTARLINTDSQIHGRVGFRDIKLTMNNNDWSAENGTRAFPPMTITINGRAIFAKGSNWVNPEIFPGTIKKETYEPLIQLAQECHMNIFRSWGGAIINKDSFFELCDEYGIMVWQEFPLACNNYVGNEKYLKILEQESISIVKRLRKYTCHVLWCGGNELFCGWSRMTDQSLALRLLNKICYEYDRSKPFIPTSPIMGVSHGSYRFIYLDGRDVFTVIQNKKNTAYTEFGIPSLPEADYLRTFIPEDEQFPPQPGGTYEFHHAFNAWCGSEPWLCRDILEYYFGQAENLEKLVEQSKWLQREGYKAVFEEARRQKPFCSMAINWCYNEPWKTAANNSIICYPHTPKSGYYAITESCRDILVSAKIPKFLWYSGELLTMELWMLNDSPKDYPNFTLKAYIEITGEKVFVSEWKTGAITANQNKKGPSVSFPLPDIEADRIIINLKCMENDAYSSTYQLKYGQLMLTE